MDISHQTRKPLEDIIASSGNILAASSSANPPKPAIHQKSEDK